MKSSKALFFVLIIFFPFIAFSQIQKHSKWSYEVSQTEVEIGKTVDLIFKVEIDKDWYLYSSDFDPDLGPQVTEFTFEANDTYELVGAIQPINPKKKYSDIFEGDYTYFTEYAEFRQTIKILKPDPSISGSYSYQVCTDVTGRCIPGIDDFTFDQIKGIEPKVEDTKEERKKEEDKSTDEEEIDEDQESPQDADTLAKKEEENEEGSTQASKKETSDNTQNQNPTETSDSEESLLAFLGLAFLTGFLALLTPCVFPMIPMTVSFFTKQSKSRRAGIKKALIYGLSIILIYTILGTLVAAFFGPTFNNWLSTHWIPNLFFFGLLVVFALSFLGMFEIVLPSSWVNKADQQADKGGYLGLFFMAFTLALVSFSCTAPIVGSILVLAAGGEFVKPILGMIAFSSAVALPFTLFAIFPSWLQSLPKSGGWLNSIKVVLGLLELALAFKFLSIADIVYHWGILDRDVFLSLWIVIFTILGFYLLGKIQFPHDSKLERIPVSRALLAIASFAFVVYMVPGLFGAPLKPLAGYLPPQSTQDFNLNDYSSSTRFASNDNEAQSSKVKYADLLHLPHNLNGFFDYEQGIAYAKKVGKPVFIDFTGHGCVNCRKMEENVWADEQVQKRLNEDYVLISLYVDERTELPESEWYTSEYDERIKKTLGAQNADLQITKFNSNAQPHYFLLDTEENILTEPFEYDPDVPKFVAFLETGLEVFEQEKAIASQSE